MATNVFDPSALLSLLPTLLPPSDKLLKSDHDALAALIHTAMSAVAFRLIAVGNSRIAESTNILPKDWNTNGPENYTFKYKHNQSSLEYVLKVGKLGARTIINAIALESDKVASLDISTSDFISSSFFPHELAAQDAAPLVHGFISSNRVADFVSQFKLMIIQKLAPGLRKEGYQEEEAELTSNSRGPPTASNQQPPPQPDTRQPTSAPFRDGNLRSSPFSAQNPLEIGRSDLDPFPQNPFSPPSLFPRGDGMFVGPNHPIFGNRNGPGSGGPWVGDGFLPPLGAPPGSRFDPIGPGPIFPHRGGRGVGGPGRGSNPPFSGDPDNDELMPPGTRDMFM